MAIDGRDIARARAERDAGGPIAPPPGAGDAYESRGVKAVSLALFWVPVVFVLWLAYISGTWLGGGWLMGVASVASTLLTIVLLWAWGKRKKRR